MYNRKKKVLFIISVPFLMNLLLLGMMKNASIRGLVEGKTKLTPFKK
jgi:hypothetical protein